MQNNAIGDREALETGLKITTENANRFLEYYEAYGVLVCVTHGYAVRNLTDHLKRNHVSSKKERSEVVKQHKSLLLRTAKEVPLPPPLGEPFPALGRPQRAFICREMFILRDCIVCPNIAYAVVEYERKEENEEVRRLVEEKLD
jgi:hypothetical protein